MARNMGLARANGQYIRALDADDLLTEGALARDISTLEENSDIGWVTSAALDMFPDSSVRGVPTDP
jgi:glycosyltransferase involved in cell wall biosynthesis